MLALDFLRVLLPYVMLRGIRMPLVSPPPVGVKLRNTNGLQQLLQPQEDLILPSSEHIRQDPARLMINRVPQPTRLRFFRNIRLHFVEL